MPSNFYVTKSAEQPIGNSCKLRHLLRMANGRPDLSLERAPHRDKTATFRQQPFDRK
jgi:hypothetical protein